MKKQGSFVPLMFGLLAVALFAILYAFFSGGHDSPDRRKQVISRKVVKKASKIKDVASKASRVKAVKIEVGDEQREKPNLADELDEDEPLSALEKRVMKELQDSLDDNDLKAVRRVLARFNMPASKGGLGGKVPKQLKMAAVAALGWFGPKAISGGVSPSGGSASSVDLIDYMVDADVEVCDSAFDAFEDSLSDLEMGDYERAELLKTVLKAVTDQDRIESLLSSLDNMRNSVKADTIISIMQTGTDAAKSGLMEQIEFYTDQDVTTVDGVRKWLAENPDDEGDAEFYGPTK